MFGKPFAKITYKDLERVVVDDNTRESHVLEYKPNLDFKDDDPDVVFAKKISSFANTFGGFLIVGVTEGKGDKKNQIWGFDDSEDRFRRRVNHVTYDWVSPPIPNC